MCQGEAEGLSNSSDHCQVRKVASLLAQALICCGSGVNNPPIRRTWACRSIAEAAVSSLTDTVHKTGQSQVLGGGDDLAGQPLGPVEVGSSQRHDAQEGHHERRDRFR